MHLFVLITAQSLSQINFKMLNKIFQSVYCKIPNYKLKTLSLVFLQTKSTKNLRLTLMFKRLYIQIEKFIYFNEAILLCLSVPFPSTSLLYYIYNVFKLLTTAQG